MFGKGSTLTLSKKIKEISEDVVVTKAKLKKLIISHKVKRYNNWKKPFVKNNKKIKISIPNGKIFPFFRKFLSDLCAPFRKFDPRRSALKKAAFSTGEKTASIFEVLTWKSSGGFRTIRN